jgi:hypothetical protein
MGCRQVLIDQPVGEFHQPSGYIKLSPGIRCGYKSVMRCWLAAFLTVPCQAAWALVIPEGWLEV